MKNTLTKAILITAASFCAAAVFADVNIDYLSAPDKTVSELLFGYNTLYCVPDQPEDGFMPDERWQAEYLPQTMQELGVTSLRYPGGHIVSFWHWDDPFAGGWVDLWDPSKTFDSRAVREQQYSGFMDLDEYIQQCKTLDIEPILGVNVLAGYKFGRVQDSIDEAVAMLDYCEQNDFDVTYLYLDNEVGHQGGLPNHIDAGAYPELVKQFSIGIKNEYPNIKLICNYIHGLTHWTVKDLVRDYGQYFDVIDKHLYYNTGVWGEYSRNDWLNDFTVDGYKSEIDSFHQFCKDTGNEHIQLGFMEWNFGGSAGTSSENGNFFDQAMVMSEIMMMFIEKNVDMACVWPIYWPGTGRNLVEFEPYKHRPSFTAMQMFKEIQGQEVLSFSSDAQNAIVLGAHAKRSETAKNPKIVILVLSKDTSESRDFTINLGDISPEFVSGTSIAEGDNGWHRSVRMSPSLNQDNQISFNVPGLSLTKITAVMSKSDINADLEVDIEDFMLLGDEWLSSPDNVFADIAPAPSGDGFVDMIDLSAFSGQWPGFYNNLFCWWEFEQAAGQEAGDSSGNSRIGTLSGTNFQDSSVRGISGDGLYFDGVDDKVTLDLAGSEWPEYTVSFWVKTSHLGQANYSGLFNTSSNNNANTFQIDVDGGNPGSYRYHGSADGIIGTVKDDWTYIAVSFSSGSADLYYNGSFVRSVSAGDTQIDRLQLGVNRSGHLPFEGIIDELRVYDDALSSGEIQDLYLSLLPQR
ncbi:LamG-like jellyroll fold domain-containing protein [Sedimentisphaera salicampi]|uniref:Alpha-L-arabinofuranosidase n=1 Tax=Sedimentisphaera salicampi TaxID=1941349 RepID=A0A1W6LNV4_9BACT|nr:LamG-like jellyroll fold domain-containing protein [Sedimentisphaera salicampi]ARN57413.1 Alpha-L-arabinofuranosidase [Sedimentisphaera salicampi]